MSAIILEGDVAEIARELPADYYDGCLTDPPYGLGFMGKGWDKGVPPTKIWVKALKVLKPGAYALVFGGARTFHRLACAMEDAGFEIQDCLIWLYGSGFPKGQDISKALDKRAGAVREVVGPSQYADRGRRTDNQVYGQSTPSGAEVITLPATDAARAWAGYNTTLKPAWEPILLAMKPLDGTFAQNALKHGTGGLAVDACRIGLVGGCHSNTPYKGGDSGNCYGKGLNDQRSPRVDGLGRWPANLLLDEEAAGMLDAQTDGASRFFYCAKADRRERGPGNSHPTVKPLALCEYLARLILPPKRDSDRRILVPFSGSGSEMIGALRAGWDDVTGIEVDSGYIRIAESRLAERGL